MPDKEPRYQAIYTIVDRETGEMVVDEKFTTDSPVYLHERLVAVDIKVKKLEYGNA